MKNVAARPHEVPQDDVQSFLAWFKALFDQNSDGIEDTILRCLAKNLFSGSMLTRTQVNKAQNSVILRPSFVYARNSAPSSAKDRWGHSQERSFVLPWTSAELDARGSGKVFDQGRAG